MGVTHKRPNVMSEKTAQQGDYFVQFGQIVITHEPCACIFVYGGFTLVDFADVALLYSTRWNVRPHRKTAYVVYNGSTIRKKLHQEITGVVGADHHNRIGWDNRRLNLRTANGQLNSFNHGPTAGKLHSAFKGVTYDPKKKLFRARIMVSGKHIGLGRFKSDVDAAKAYDVAATKYFGEFAYVNFKD